MELKYSTPVSERERKKKSSGGVIEKTCGEELDAGAELKDEGAEGS